MDLTVREEVAACTKPGEIGALLRREGLYSSSLAEWRRAQERGALAGLTPKKRGPAAKIPHPLERKVLELQREVSRLQCAAVWRRAEGEAAVALLYADFENAIARLDQALRELSGAPEVARRA